MLNAYYQTYMNNLLLIGIFVVHPKVMLLLVTRNVLSLPSLQTTPVIEFNIEIWRHVWPLTYALSE